VAEKATVQQHKISASTNTDLIIFNFPFLSVGLSYYGLYFCIIAHDVASRQLAYLPVFSFLSVEYKMKVIPEKDQSANKIGDNRGP
jgi:hypothetical protein